jgi:hypothetical protein
MVPNVTGRIRPLIRPSRIQGSRDGAPIENGAQPAPPWQEYRFGASHAGIISTGIPLDPRPLTT